jgi:hypothetical protein
MKLCAPPNRSGQLPRFSLQQERTEHRCACVVVSGTDPGGLGECVS